MSLVEVVLLAGFALVVVVLLRRANEVCAIGVREGRLLVVRGGAPQVLVNDVADVLRRGGVRTTTVRIVKEGGAARIVASGVDEITAQRLRNVLTAHPYRLLASAPRPRARNLGQRLGIAWLAFWLDDGK